MKFIHPIIWPLLIIICSFLVANPQIYSENSFRIRAIEYAHDNDNVDIQTAIQKEYESSRGTIVPKAQGIWVKITVPEAVRNWNTDIVLFTGSNEAIEAMNAYVISENKIESLGICDFNFQSESCLIPTLQYSFPIKKSLVKKGSEVYINLLPGDTVLRNEFYFMKVSYFNKVSTFLNSFLGFSLGYFFTIAIFSLIIFLSFREFSFLAFSLFYLNLFILTGINRGYWDVFKFESINIDGASLAQPFFILVMFFDLLFIKIFFEISNRNRRINFMYNLFLIAILVLLVLFHIPTIKFYAHAVLYPVGLVMMPFVLISLGYFLINKHKHTATFATAWIIAMACNIIWILYREGAIQGFWFFGYYAIFGRIIEGFILNIVIYQKLYGLAVKATYLKVKQEENSIIKTLLRTLSHDLSNTTQVIKTSADLILKRGPSLIEKNIPYILAAVESQKNIIENAKRNYFLPGEGLVRLSPTDLISAINKTISNYSLDAANKDIEWLVTKQQDEVFVLSESVSLENQVLGNLVSNAIKFSKSGGVIEFKVERSGSDDVSLKIIDQGIGLSEDLMERLFDEETNISRPGTQGEVGAGHGMLIVQSFMNAYGGTLGIQSQVNKGTIVNLNFKSATVK